MMNTLAAGVSYVDLNFLRVPRIIATAVLHGPRDVALIDPGPSSTLPTLKRELAESGIGIGDVRQILLTHIHLDHAGATGTLVRENPGIRVYVHEKGARHVVFPDSLIASATRLWGHDMDRLWGEVRAVPPESITALAGGERISAGNRSVDVVYTPGHAQHHVSYFTNDAGVAFVGDTAGIRLSDDGFILPPTPPPDIDLPAWHRSLALIGQWAPDTLFVTHFGAYGPSAPHLATLAEHLEMVSEIARRSLERDGSDEAREEWFAEELRHLLRRRLTASEVDAYEVAGRFDISWRGLARYWRKRA
jgi:glyoxylase-like metal-dependent hydrolase (beta-lactamase superfamily II)